MCLVLVASDPDSEYPIVVAANRDEYHERAADALHWWPDRPQILAGRDRVAGGTWMGASAAGRFGCLLNDHRMPKPQNAPSRGALIPEFLEIEDPAEWREDLRARYRAYAGFHIVTGDGRGVHYAASASPDPVALGRGVQVIDNTGLDADDPRSHRARERLAPLLRGGASIEALLEALADPAEPEPGPGDARGLFIAAPVFGTRCSTVLRMDRRGGAICRERRFDAAGAMIGERTFAWDCASADTRVGSC